MRPIYFISVYCRKLRRQMEEATGRNRDVIVDVVVYHHGVRERQEIWRRKALQPA
jgi:hypothetical protein